MPETIEGLTHIGQDYHSGEMFFFGVSEHCYYPDELKGYRMLFAKAELCLPKNIIHQGINPTVQNTLNTFEMFGKSEMVL